MRMLGKKAIWRTKQNQEGRSWNFPSRSPYLPLPQKSAKHFDLGFILVEFLSKTNQPLFIFHCKQKAFKSLSFFTSCYSSGELYQNPAPLSPFRIVSQTLTPLAVHHFRFQKGGTEEGSWLGAFDSSDKHGRKLGSMKMRWWCNFSTKENSAA